MPAIIPPYLREIQLMTMALVLIVGLITTFRKGGVDGHAKVFLATYYGASLATLLIAYIFLFTDGRSFVHLLRTKPLAMSLVLPAGYLYVRQTLDKRPLVRADGIHLAVFLLYAVDMMPFFLRPATEKMEWLGDMEPHALGWFMPAYGHAILRYAVFAAYLWLDVRLILRMNRQHREGISGLNRPQCHWIRLFVASQFMLMIPLVFFMIGGSTMAVVMALDIVSLIMMGIQIAYLLLHPEVLYGDGFQALIPRVPEGSGNLTVSIAEKSRPAQAAEKAGLLTDRLDDHMAMNKPYLKQGYKLRDLADEIDVPMTRLSAHINHVHGTNFSGYVNELRIEHAISKMRDHAHRNKTLEAIAEESGFQNRITFIRAFKRSKGVIPSRFMDTDRLG